MTRNVARAGRHAGEDAGPARQSDEVGACLQPTRASSNEMREVRRLAVPQLRNQESRALRLSGSERRTVPLQNDGRGLVHELLRAQSWPWTDEPTASASERVGGSQSIKGWVPRSNSPKPSQADGGCVGSTGWCPVLTLLSLRGLTEDASVASESAVSLEWTLMACHSLHGGVLDTNRHISLGRRGQRVERTNLLRDLPVCAHSVSPLASSSIVLCEKGYPSAVRLLYL